MKNKTIIYLMLAHAELCRSVELSDPEVKKNWAKSVCLLNGEDPEAEFRTSEPEPSNTPTRSELLKAIEKSVEVLEKYESTSAWGCGGDDYGEDYNNDDVIDMREELSILLTKAKGE